MLLNVEDLLRVLGDLLGLSTIKGNAFPGRLLLLLLELVSNRKQTSPMLLCLLSVKSIRHSRYLKPSQIGVVLLQQSLIEGCSQSGANNAFGHSHNSVGFTKNQPLIPNPCQQALASALAHKGESFEESDAFVFEGT